MNHSVLQLTMRTPRAETLLSAPTVEASWLSSKQLRDHHHQKLKAAQGGVPALLSMHILMAAGVESEQPYFSRNMIY